MSESPHPEHMRIFISVSYTTSAPQSAFIAAIKQLIVDSGFHVVTVERFDEQEGLHILHRISAEIANADATLIIAFEKLRLHAGIMYPNSPDPYDIQDRGYVSVWSHIEGAMAVYARKPFLFLYEEGMHREGLFKHSEHHAVSFLLPTAQEPLSRDLVSRITRWLRELV